MKKGTKIILAAALCLLLITGANTFIGEAINKDNVETACCSPAPLASPVDARVYDASPMLDTDVPTEEDTNEQEDENTLDITKSESAEGSDNTEENRFEEVYNLAIGHISEILSLAAFIGSLICAVIYKSGLMPLMENGLKGLKNATVKIKEATDKAENENKESLRAMTSRIDALEASITDMCNAFLSLSDSLKGYKNQLSHQKRLDTILEGELDMLYDIFMTSALPEYEKARVGDRMTKLKEVLNSGESEK